MRSKTDDFNYQHNWAWDNVNGFFKLISSNNSTKEGPQGYYTTHSLAYVVAGDVLAWDTAGTCSVTSATLDHAMFVVSVSGSSGSRGIDDIYIAAHSPNTVSIRAPLRSYMAQCGLSTLTENNFAVAHINCGYYNLSKETLNQSSAVDDESFPPILRFEKLEIHPVFLRFSNLVLTKNLSPSILGD